MSDTTSIRVVMPIGELTAPRCAVDQFKAGELTVTSLDDGHTVSVFYEGEWLSATCYDEQGYPLYEFMSDELKVRLQTAARQFARRSVA